MKQKFFLAVQFMTKYIEKHTIIRDFWRLFVKNFSCSVESRQKYFVDMLGLMPH